MKKKRKVNVGGSHTLNLTPEILTQEQESSDMIFSEIEISRIEQLYSLVQ